MESVFVYVNKSFFRRTANLLAPWHIDPNYSRVRVTIRVKRKLVATLYIVAEVTAPEPAISLSQAPSNFDRRAVLKKAMPLNSLKDASLTCKEVQRNRVYCLTLRQSSLLTGGTVNLYHERYLEIDKIFSCLHACRRPLGVFLDLFDRLHSGLGRGSCDETAAAEAAASASDGSGARIWIVRLLNNLTVQTLGLCSDYLYVLRVCPERFELQDVNQSCILPCPLANIVKYGTLNGWFFLHYATSTSAGGGQHGGYLAMECIRARQLHVLFKQYLGGKFIRKWPSDPCLRSSASLRSQQQQQQPQQTGSSSVRRRDASFNAHGPRSRCANLDVVAAAAASSPRRRGGSFGRFSFFKKHRLKDSGGWTFAHHQSDVSVASLSSGGGDGGDGAGSGSSGASSVASLSHLDEKPSRRRSVIKSIRRVSRSLRHRREKRGELVT